MSRYIDVDTLKNKTTRVNHIWNGTTNAEGKGLDEIIDDIPTADVVKVVRCKDCRHYSEEGKVTRYSWCYKWKNAVNFGDFCSYGERAEE